MCEREREEENWHFIVVSGTVLFNDYYVCLQTVLDLQFKAKCNALFLFVMFQTEFIEINVLSSNILILLKLTLGILAS